MSNILIGFTSPPAECLWRLTTPPCIGRIPQ